jgi:hypothetical protein
MTFMKAAIAGKETEQFLSDSPDSHLLRAESDLPARPARAPAMAAHGPTSGVAKVATAVSNEGPNGKVAAPVALAASGAKPMGRPVAAHVAPEPAGAVPMKALVKPAIAPQSSAPPGPQTAKIKPALSNQ